MSFLAMLYVLYSKEFLPRHSLMSGSVGMSLTNHYIGKIPLALFAQGTAVQKKAGNYSRANTEGPALLVSWDFKS